MFDENEICYFFSLCHARPCSRPDRALYSMLATSIKIIANFHLKRALNGAKEAIFLGRICLLTNPPQTNLYGRRERLVLVNPFLITSHLLSTTVPVFTTFRYLWI